MFHMCNNPAWHLFNVQLITLLSIKKVQKSTTIKSMFAFQNISFNPLLGKKSHSGSKNFSYLLFKQRFHSALQLQLEFVPHVG